LVKFEISVFVVGGPLCGKGTGVAAETAIFTGFYIKATERDVLFPVEDWSFDF
jgi:hypothetical protein